MVVDFPPLHKEGMKGRLKETITKLFNKSSLRERRRFLQRLMPSAEVLIWSRLNRRQMRGYKFRRQYSVGRYVLDFNCPGLKLAIEVDGDSHFRDSARKYDVARQKEIEEYDIRFLRITNGDVYHQLYSVLQLIYDTIDMIELERKE